MEAVKTSSSQALQAPQASKRVERTERTEPRSNPETQAQALAAKKAEVQPPPRATVNTRGEIVGQLLNVKA
ncbi:hypothetical protein DIC66_18165 [Rhodoferax lacus]|uniref:Uncharacterized protein n=1 Tax=Rhodoferax lacus TaxID=2184758 RepID=A0A3E1R7S6_9BURK|nr:hypothetical protein [Rhodoferax lacus]RFO95419.1 hypothetical protein DIC66_18165 [Rhodoferax lacus]